MLVIPRVYLIKPYSGANIYVLEDPSGLYLIDAGSEGNDELILSEIESYFGAEPEDIRGILITHAHRDHIGSLPELIDVTGADIYIHEADLPLLKKNLGLQEIPNIKTLQGGETLEIFGGLRVIHAPGHTDGSVVYYKPGEFIAVGDVIVVGPKGELRLPLQRLTKDVEQEIKSVIILGGLDFKAILPGHGKPVTERAKAKLLTFIEKLKSISGGVGYGVQNV